jgi:glucose/arabinose dehydrogenase
MKTMKHSLMSIVALIFLISACSGDKSKVKLPSPDPNNAGINLPEGFGAIVTADNLGRARHMAVNDNGDLYVKLRKVKDGHGIIALKDIDGNGIMDEQKGFMPYGGTGIGIHNGYLYCSSDSNVYRYKLKPGELVPTSEMELIATGFPKQGPHNTKPMTFDNAGHMYVSVGAPVNAGEKDAFQVESPGIDPSPYIIQQAGIWQFDANKPNQIQQDAYHYAKGIRNALAMDWDSKTNSLYSVSHGRDQLSGFWPEVFSLEQNANQPAEQFLKVSKDQDYGWPYCFYDSEQGKQVLGPEFGGDGLKTERCEGIEPALLGLPAHSAPNDLIFYTGDMFPARYKNGAFVALHGSWNRAPFPQMGYSVVFIPFKDGKPTGEFEEFATGIAGKDVINAPNEAMYRPTGLAQGADGSLFICDSVKGRIWRIYYYK